MNNNVILFTHHFVNDFVKWSFENVKFLNPRWDVVPIGFKGFNLLENSITVNIKDYPHNANILENVPQYNQEWASPDLFCYDGYRQLPNYSGYFLYEYDTVCNIPIEKFFNINVDFFGNNINNPAEETWDWAKLYRKHNPFNNYFVNLYGYGQSTCIWFKNHILKKCYEEVIKNKHLYNDMLSEIRGGTLVKQFTELRKPMENIRDYIWWEIDGLKLDRDEYFLHPIKNFEILDLISKQPAIVKF